jgi:hypothetical protein
MQAYSATNFVRLSGTQEEISDLLGPLSNFEGTWAGTKGWNLITVPAAGSDPRGAGNFQIITQQYAETWSFVPVGAPVRNRGGSLDQFIGGLQYEQRVFNLETGEPLHVENGMLLNLTRVVTNPGDQQVSGQKFSIARLANIPHGNTCLLQGDAFFSSGPPTIPPLSVVPTNVGPIAGYNEQFTLVPPTNPMFPAFHPTETLQNAIAGQNITSTTTLVLDTANGGGILNIDFIAATATSTAMQAIFWLETVQPPGGGPLIQQLQYSQVINLEFDVPFGGGQGLITWPHVTINTMVKQ